MKPILATRIHEFRKLRGYTQSQLAKMLGVTEANFSKYERGNSEPPCTKLCQISKFLNVSPAYLLGMIENPLLSDDAKVNVINDEEYGWIEIIRALPMKDRESIQRILTCMASKST